MFCPRLDHFARLNEDSTVSRCGHMVNAPRLLLMKKWKAVTGQRDKDTEEWPTECQRCQTTELASGTSIRIDSIRRDKLLKTFKDDYLIIGWCLRQRMQLSMPVLLCRTVNNYR